MRSVMLCVVLVSASVLSGQTSLQALLKQAVQQERSRSWSGAVATWKEIVAQNPMMPSYWERLGQASREAGDFKTAISALEKSWGLGGSYPANTAYDLAVCYVKTGDHERAFEWLGRSLGVTPERVWRSRSIRLRSIGFAHDDPELAPLREDSRFAKLTRYADASKLSREEGWRHDLSFLQWEIKRRHWDPFRIKTEAEFDAAVQKLHEAIPALRDEQIAVEMMRLVASIGDAHTWIRAPYAQAAKSQNVSVQFFHFTEGVFIIRASPKYADLVGLELVAVGEHPLKAVMAKLDPVISKDNAMWSKVLGAELLTYPRLLFGLGLIPEADKVTLSLREPSGRIRKITMHEQSEAATADWPSARNSSALYVKNVQTNFWFEYLADSKTVYCQLNAMKEGEERFRSFVDRLFRFVDQHEVKQLVIDLRWNTGGENVLNQSLVHALIRSEKVRQRGKLFVVIGRHTASAAQCLAAEIERNTSAVFVGEPTSSSPNFVGTEVHLRLPYSGMRGSISDLFWQNSRATDYRVWLAPEIYTPLSFALYSTNRDPSMEAILAYRE